MKEQKPSDKSNKPNEVKANSSSNAKRVRPGVYRFKTYEEADAHMEEIFPHLKK